jgi:PPOX class probable FMN-dependent enzyme
MDPSHDATPDAVSDAAPDPTSDVASDVVTSIEQLEALYPDPVATSLLKVSDHITPLQREYVEASPFVVIASVGPDGVDCTPRGDPAGFVRVVDERTLQIPDRRGNNRLDTLRNLVRDPRIALLFLVPGIGVTLRVNGTAVIRTDDSLRRRFTVQGKVPATVIEVAVGEVYTQCPKALVRSDLWNPEHFRGPDDLPTVGQITEQVSDGALDGSAYDSAYPQRIRDTIY